MTTELFTKGYGNNNEDYCKIVELEGRILVILADGMGGLSLGAEAAESVCSSIADYASNHIDDEDLWEEAFGYADSILRELSISFHSNMGAAVTALVISDYSYEVAWQGNIRLYILRNNQLQQINTDHTIDNGYGKKMLTRCLKGGGLRGKIPSVILPFQTDDTLYLCTDGFYNHYEKEMESGDIPSAFVDMVPMDDATCVVIKN